MKHIVFFSFCLFVSWQAAFATTYTFTQAGNWETASNWQGGNMPPNPLPAGNSIVINSQCLLSSARTISGTLSISDPYTKLTIQSGGSLIVDGFMTNSDNGVLWVNNGGSVTVNAGKTFTFTSGAVTIFSGGTMTNHGTMNISTVLNMYGSFTNTGTFNADGLIIMGDHTTGTFNNSGIINNTRQFTLHGELTLSGSGTFNNNGTLEGGGTFDGNFTNPPGGTVFVFGYGNNCVDFTGNFTNQGILAFYYVGDTPCSSQTKLNVGGTLTLGGSMEVNFNLALPITMSIVYTFIEAGTLTGTFSSISAPNAPNSTVLYNNPGPGKATIFYNPGHTITASAGVDGSISPAGAVTVAPGGNQTFTITPNPGYCVQSVLVDGNNVGAVTSHTFSNVTADHIISASFAAADIWYLDADGDGYYASTQSACASPGAGWRSTIPAGGNGDCSDNDATIYPGAIDVCDNKDNDCDQIVDEGGNGAPTGWAAGNVGGATNTSNSFTCGGAGAVLNVSSQGFSGAANSDLLFSDYQQRCGDASITTHITGNPAPGWAGIYIRENLTAGSKMVALKTNLNSFLRRESRTTANGNKTTTQNPLYANNTWIRLTRTGNTFTFYTSPDGVTWAPFGTVTIAMGSCVYLGVFAESINAGTTITASFDHVTVTGGAPLPLAAAPGSGFTVSEGAPTPDFQLYPNPASGTVYLQWESPHSLAELLQVSVFDALGRRMSTHSIIATSGDLPLDQLSNLPNGSYWVQVQAPGLMPVTKRVVLQR